MNHIRLNEGLMRIIRTDPVTGKRHELLLPITKEQWNNYCNGESIQNAMPHLSPDEREFIMTGIAHDSWKEIFKEE